MCIWILSCWIDMAQAQIVTAFYIYLYFQWHHYRNHQNKQHFILFSYMTAINKKKDTNSPTNKSSFTIFLSALVCLYWLYRYIIYIALHTSIFSFNLNYFFKNMSHWTAYTGIKPHIRHAHIHLTWNVIRGNWNASAYNKYVIRRLYTETRYSWIVFELMHEWKIHKIKKKPTRI